MATKQILKLFPETYVNTHVDVAPGKLSFHIFFQKA
jgi:hypothetical protein